MIQPEQIVISRTDSIGDVVLTLPLAGILRKQLPRSKIFFLGRTYTRPVIELSKYVDEFINWDELEKLPMKKQVHFMEKREIDCIIHVFPNKKVARMAKKAKIIYRIGTSHRTFHLTTCNIKPNFSRKKSDLHEAQLNVKLLESLGINEIPNKEQLQEYYGINVPEIKKIHPLIDTHKFNLILHPKSKGSAREWGLDNFSKLITLLPPEKYNVFISGTKEEGMLMRDILEKHKDRIHDITGKFSLLEFINFIIRCDGLVAASTGPLHIASALGKKAIGIYPPIRPMHPGRWAPIGKDVHVLVLNKECNDCRKTNDCECMRKISPEEVVEVLTHDF